MTTMTQDERVGQESQWFASWFDSPHYHRLYGYRDGSEAAGFVDALLQRLGPTPGSDVADLGCGAGRHARQLAARGFHVTGLDLSAGSIAEARRFERRGLRFVRHDMRDPFGRQHFDIVFNFFTSFGYFDEAFEHLQVVSNIAEALRDGGTLVLDYLNVGYAEGRQTREETRTIDGTTYRLTRWSDARHFFKRIEIEAPAARPLVYVEKVAKFGLEEFRVMFARQHLSIAEVYGDYDLTAYDAGSSPRLILVARKAAASVAALGPRQTLADAA